MRNWMFLAEMNVESRENVIYNTMKETVGRNRKIVPSVDEVYFKYNHFWIPIWYIEAVQYDHDSELQKLQFDPELRYLQQQKWKWE